MEKLTKQFLLDRGFKLVGGEYGGAYIMRNPDKSVCDAIEVLLDDDCFHIHHYFADDSELGCPWETFNKINDISLTVDMFIKTLEVLGLDDEWIKSIKDNANEVIPKFKIGQTIRRDDGHSAPYTIVDIRDGRYIFKEDRDFKAKITDQDNWITEEEFQSKLGGWAKARYSIHPALDTY